MIANSSVTDPVKTAAPLDELAAPSAIAGPVAASARTVASAAPVDRRRRDDMRAPRVAGSSGRDAPPEDARETSNRTETACPFTRPSPERRPRRRRSPRSPRSPDASRALSRLFAPAERRGDRPACGRQERKARGAGQEHTRHGEAVLAAALVAVLLGGVVLGAVGAPGLVLGRLGREDGDREGACRGVPARVLR